MKKYILDEDGCPVEEPSLWKWASWFENADRRVALYERDGYKVSTVFLGIDHRFLPGGPPILYETMMFNDETVVALGRELDIGEEMDTLRYSTRDDALIGHEKMVHKLDQLLDSTKEKIEALNLK